MATVADTARSISWWKEPTKDQWYAWVAAWLGWTLDAFDFTAFLLIIVPIAKEFDVPVTAVTAVLTITLWMRLVGATANGWLADRIGRKAPLMISIGWYSVCNFLAGLAPSFFLLFLFRALLGIGMGAMACRRRAGDGDLAGPLARLHGRGDAGLLGNRVFVVECALRALL
jgi:SHS family lactate transporter-like MFS transporter